MAIKDKNQLSKNLIHFRKLHKMNQTQLAAAIDIPRERYAKYENNTEPPLEILKKLASIYEISVDTLIEAKQYVSHKISPELLKFGDVSPVETSDKPPEVTEILEKIDTLSPMLKRIIYEEIINKIEGN